MKKLWLIIQREYLTRVKKRSFILTTLLTPLAFALFIVVVSFIFSYESDEAKRIAIIDQGEMLNQRIKDEKSLYFKFEKRSLEELKADYSSDKYQGILVIPKVNDIKNRSHDIYFYSEDQLGLDMQMAIERKVANAIRDYKAKELNLDQESLKLLETRVTLDPEPIKETSVNDSKFTSFIAAGIGGAMGMIMYMTVFIYGMMVMRGVMEEKTSRIVEVMISSVRPFQLMLGKIIGVGAVGLTQLAIWLVLIPAIMFLAQISFGIDTSQMAEMPAGAEINMEDAEAQAAMIIQEFKAINWWAIVPLFIIFFLGGYFLYASLFAAVGSAMGDDLGEGQALTIPITIPVILAFYIMFAAIQSPNSSLAVWSSIFPLFSPIVMPARLAFDPPLWQVLTSVVVLIGTSIFFVWLSARIYRVGILMYGKKVSFKQLGKWMFYKD